MLILIGGPSCSGKTTLARKLETLLNADDIDMDNFFKTASEKKKDKIKLSWDDPSVLRWDLFNSTILKLMQNETVEMPFYDKTDASRKFKKFIPKQNLIIEGIWALSERVKVSADLKIYVDVDVKTRFKRRLDRDSSWFSRPIEKIREAWKKDVIPYEQKFVLPTKVNADVVVKNSTNRCAQKIVKILSEK